MLSEEQKFEPIPLTRIVSNGLEAIQPPWLCDYWRQKLDFVVWSWNERIKSTMTLSGHTNTKKAKNEQALSQNDDHLLFSYQSGGAYEVCAPPPLA